MLAALGHTVEGIDVDDFREVPSIHGEMDHEQLILWKALAARQPKVRFQHYHDSTIPFADTTFDAVMAYGVIEHIPEEALRPVMRETVRVMKKGGKLLVSYLPRTWALLELILIAARQPHHTRRWGDEEIRRFLAEHEMRTVLSKRIIFAPQYPAAFTNRHKAILTSSTRASAPSRSSRATCCSSRSAVAQRALRRVIPSRSFMYTCRRRGWGGAGSSATARTLGRSGKGTRRCGGVTWM